MSKFNEFYEARNIIKDIVKKDFIGPIEEDEILYNDPLTYYTSGLIYPQNTPIEEEEEIEENKENSEEFQDEAMNRNEFMSITNHPSSFSITATIKNEVEDIKLTVNYAKYVPMKISKEKIDVSKEKIDSKESNFPKISWNRNSFSKTLIVKLPEKNKISELIDIEENLKAQVRTTFIVGDGSNEPIKALTVSIINTNILTPINSDNNKKNTSKSRKIEKNSKTFFQVSLKLTSSTEDDFNSENSAIFIDNNINSEGTSDEEFKNFCMLYSHVKNYATGHGCSVDWNENNYGAYEIFTDFLPSYELKQMKAAIKKDLEEDKDIFNMYFMFNNDRTIIYNKLKKFSSSYKKWIKQQKEDMNELNKKYHQIANNNIGLCEESQKRIDRNIELLLNDDKVFKAFQLMNKAMFNQRVQFEKRVNYKDKNYDELEIIKKIEWYPFQLGFILQCLSDIVDENSEYRDVVDLLWFPTGGGKTEAYLGLCAFTIFFRKLRDEELSGGVAILMRYTLRLLTVQQFERAHALICACELIRKEEKLKGEPISIGLYVGGGLTPNKRKEAFTNLNKLINGEDVKEGSPYQIQNCPWCGEELNILRNDYEENLPQSSYVMNNSSSSLTIKCANENCEFHNKLPVYLVDEDIYEHRPTLIISTIDKFARIPWEEKAGNLFAKNSLGNRPPELIIQDELHLISGPLGTLAGLYEVMIRKLCEFNNKPSKIIASTATIRNAKKQIGGLYGKEFRQFPSSGINIRDSYFAEETSSNEKPTREYLGLYIPSKSEATTRAKLYSTLLFSSRYLVDLGYDDKIIDNFWTLTGYFNTLKALGSTVNQVYDNIQDRYKFLYLNKFKNISYLNKSKEIKQKPENVKLYVPDTLTELTSRKPSSEISSILKKIEDKPIDVLLASNMISVGVDISRLGLMIINNQPHNNSEYIQASSRIGRSNPGMVYTLYKSGSSRDKSHYEQFKLYHSSLYKYVEATSVTPFSSKSKEKALAAIFIGLCRHLIPNLSLNEYANNFNKLSQKDMEIKEMIKDYIVSEAKKCVSFGVGLESDNDNLYRELKYIEDFWINKIENLNDEILVYYKHADEEHSLLATDSKVYGDENIVLLNSMRSVDPESNIFIIEE